MTAFSKMYYPKLTFASSTIEGIFLFGILCLYNKIYGLDPKISLEVSKSCIWKKPIFASEQHPYGVKVYWLARMGQNFDDYPGFQSKITPPKHFSWQCMCIYFVSLQYILDVHIHACLWSNMLFC